MLSKKEVVVVVNATVIGMTKNMMDYWLTMRQHLNQRELHVFIYSWDFDYNNVWLLDLLKRAESPIYRSLKIHLIHEKYYDKGPYSFFYKFQKYLGYSSDTIEPISGKRCFYFYTLVRLLQLVEQHNKDAYVIRMRAGDNINMPTRTSMDQYCLVGSLLLFQYQSLGINFMPEQQETCISDVYLTSGMSKTSVSDHFFAASFKDLNQIYTTDIDTLFDRLTSVYDKYLEKVPKLDKGSLYSGTRDELISINSDQMYLPHESGVFIKDLIDKYHPNLITSVGLLAQFYTFGASITNPWFEIHPNRVSEVSPSIDAGYSNYKEKYVCDISPNDFKNNPDIIKDTEKKLKPLISKHTKQAVPSKLV